uniref:Gastric triacylglycerol lipase-like n=1 Tax=Diabrotica virgifera virgifera TaxID=50390 RepID=A0A6P7FBS1_DIAVI
MPSIFYIIFSIVFIFINSGISVRVCPSFSDYYKWSSSCYNNDIENLNMTEVLRRWGCIAEEYYIFTDDDYELLIVRAYKKITHPTPIILAHGILMSGLSFLSLGNQSLAYNIIESGRQLFFLNFRGNRYSKRHAKGLTQDDYAYWNFSLDEKIMFDVPKTIDLVYNMTGQKAIFIGFSMGNTVSLAYATLYPEQASKKLVGIISLGTACYFRNIRSVIRWISPFFSIAQPFLRLLWNGKMFPREQEPLGLCASGPIQFFICYNLAAPFLGYDFKGVSPEHFPIVTYFFPDTMGETLLKHYTQIWGSGEYRRFDHGREGNLKKYGTPKPPYYDLSKINIPVAQFLGEGDFITTVENGKLVDSLLNPNVRCGVKIMKYKKWTHDDFINHRDQMTYLVPSVLQKLDNMENSRC